jgi:hypothetical protein
VQWKRLWITQLDNSEFGADLLAANANDATDMGELIEFDNTGILDARDGAKVSDETK